MDDGILEDRMWAKINIETRKKSASPVGLHAAPMSWYLFAIQAF